MRFIRYMQTWLAVEAFSGKSYCLEELALRENYKVAGLCEVLGCSERYLYAAFIRDIGLSPKTWMNLERMVVARRKLEGGLDIERTAEDLGFLSLEAFNRAFYAVYRMSPARYVKTRIIFDPTKPLPPYWLMNRHKPRLQTASLEEE